MMMLNEAKLVYFRKEQYYQDKYSKQERSYDTFDAAERLYDNLILKE